MCNTCGTGTRIDAGGLCPACLFRLALERAASIPEYQIVSPLGPRTFAAQDLGSRRLLVVKEVAVPHDLAPETIDSIAASLAAFTDDAVAVTVALEPGEPAVKLVRTFVHGKPLAAWMASASAGAKAAAFDRLRAALDAIHAHGLAHGRLAPGNVIVEIDGTPVIVDLGVGMLARRGVAQAEDHEALRALERQFLAP